MIINSVFASKLAELTFSANSSKAILADAMLFSSIETSLASATLVFAVLSLIALLAYFFRNQGALVDAASYGKSSLRLESLEPRRLLHGGVEGNDPEYDPDSFHIHAELNILLDGDLVEIPSDVGIDNSGNFLSFVHTHNSDNLLHAHNINGDTPADFITLGDFFDTWMNNAGVAGNNPDAIFNENQILGNPVDANHTLRMYVNGELTTQFEDYEIHDGDVIFVTLDADVDPDEPTFVPIEDVTLSAGSPLHIPLDGFDPDGQTITYSAASSDDSVVSTFVPEGNRSLRLTVEDFGEMVFELYENRAPRVTEQIISLANVGFYDDVTFHRVIDNFVIQGGDPTGTGSGGSPLGDFDDQFHVDLQHNRGGILSMAKSTDDTNDSQFFITEVATRTLDSNHSIFGQLIEGENVRQLISNVATSGPPNDRPLTDVVIETAEVFVDNENGVLMLSAPEGTSGEATITVTAVDEDGNDFQRSFQVTVVPDATDSKPFLSDIGNPTTSINTPIDIVLEAQDVEGDPIQFGFIQPANATVSLTSDPVVPIGQTAITNLTVTPDDGFVGDISLQLFVHRPEDSTASTNTDIQRITVTVEDANLIPTLDDSYSVAEDSVLSVEVVDGVLENDGDSSTGLLTSSLVTGPTNGTLALSSNGSFTYTPTANFNGTDSFTYRASDGTDDSAATTVTITVTPVNDAPIAVGEQFTTSESNTLSIAASEGLLTNDSDLDNDLLTVALVDGPTGGALALNTDGSFNYTPNEGFTGTDGFSYRVNDGTEDSNIVNVTIDVEDFIPSSIAGMSFFDANNNGALDADEDMLGGVNIVLSGTNNSGNSVQISQMTTADGHYSFDGLAPGLYTISQSQPLFLLDGEEIAGTLVDGSDTNDQFTITLDGTGGSMENMFAERGRAAKYISTRDFLASTPETYILAATDRTDGTLWFSFHNGWEGFVSAEVDLEDDLSAYTLTLVDQAGQVFTTTESTGVGSKIQFLGVEGSSRLVRIAGDSSDFDLTPSDTSVTATDDNYSATEDTTLTVDAASGVLSNDTDEDGDALTATLVSGTTNGTVNLNSDGSFSFIPNSNFNGTDSFTYRANDSSQGTDLATVTISVTAVNDAPQASADSFSTTEDSALTIDAAGVLANDNDVDGDSLTAIIDSLPSNGNVSLNSNGSFVYTPDADFSGTDLFRYHAQDSTGANSSVATVTINVTEVNDAPVAVPDNDYHTDEDSPLVVNATNGVLANDTDVDDSDLKAVLVNSTTNGTLTLNDDGSFTYTPNADFSGDDTFQYRVEDSDGAQSDTTTVTIRVDSVNDAPISLDDSVTTSVNVAVDIDVLANDSDKEGPLDPTSINITSPVSNGTLEVRSDGSITYTPDSDFVGQDSFLYTVQDSDGAVSGEAMVTITVTSPPVAADDSSTTDEDTSVIIDILANDVDSDGQVDPMSVVIIDQPAHGTLEVDASTGQVTYMPELNFFGSDSFTYQVNDDTGMTSNVAKVTIDISDVNDLTETNSDEAGTDEDTPVSIDVLNNDNDVDGTIDPTTVAISTLPQNGTVIVDSMTGEITYTPNENFFGTDTFGYTVEDDDSETSAEGQVTITIDPVNDSPVANDDQVNTELNMSVGIDILENDIDVEDTLDSNSVTITSSPASGNISLESDGTFTYSPDPDFVGTDSFTYTVQDSEGAVSNQATVTIMVNDPSLNTPPVAVDDDVETNEDESVQIDVLANDTDADGDPLTAILVDGPSNGTLEVVSNQLNDGIPDVIVDATTGNVTVDTNGQDVASIIIESAAGIFNGIVSPHWDKKGAFAADNDALISNALINDSFTGVDDLGDGVMGPISTEFDFRQDITVTYLLAGSDNEQIGNVIVGMGSLGEGMFLYTPNPDFFGTDTFTYKANDSQADSNVATVTITVNPINDGPIAIDDSAETTIDTSVDIDILANDIDIDGTLDPSSITIISSPSSGSLSFDANVMVTYTPDPGFTGNDSFSYTVKDDSAAVSNEGVVTVTVMSTNANQRPVANDDAVSTEQNISATIDILANDTDADGVIDPTTVVITSDPTNGTVTINVDGSVDYMPNADFLGTDGFTYTVNDDSAATSNEATVSVDVNAPVSNQTPVATDDSAMTEIDTAITIDILANDVDVDGTLDPGSVTFSVDPTNGILVLNADGSVLYTPNAGVTGEDSFVYTVSDNEGAVSNEATVMITISPFNNPPTAVDDAYAVIEDNVLVVESTDGLLLNDGDPEGISLNAVLSTGAVNGTVNLLADGSFTYAPNPDFFGTDSFTYVANDGLKDSAEATVTITVSGENDRPVAEDNSYNTDQNSKLNIEAISGVLNNDFDVDNDPLTIQIVTEVANGTLMLDEDGSFMYTPEFDFIGTDSFNYIVHDGLLNSFEATVTIIVNPADDAVPAVIVNPLTGNVTVDTAGLELSSIIIQSAAGVFDGSSDPVWADKGAFSADTDELLSNALFDGSISGVNDLGDEVMGEIPPSLDLLNDISVFYLLQDSVEELTGIVVVDFGVIAAIEELATGDSGYVESVDSIMAQQ